MLTNECKNDFEIWYLKRYYFKTMHQLGWLYLWLFYRMDLSKQYGIYIDFADSVSIEIYIAATTKDGIIKCMPVVNKNAIGWVNTRRKARLLTLKELDNIYNI